MTAFGLSIKAGVECKLDPGFFIGASKYLVN